MTSPSEGSPNTVFAAMFLRARMTSPSDGSPNTVFAAMFLRARMTSPSDGPLFTSGIYTTRTLSASQYPLLRARIVSCSTSTGGHHWRSSLAIKVDKSYVLMVLCTSNSVKGVTSAGDVHSVPSLAAKVLWVQRLTCRTPMSFMTTTIILTLTALPLPSAMSRWFSRKKLLVLLK